jgi:hypothetical protein
VDDDDEPAPLPEPEAEPDKDLPEEDSPDELSPLSLPSPPLPPLRFQSSSDSKKLAIEFLVFNVVKTLCFCDSVLIGCSNPFVTALCTSNAIVKISIFMFIYIVFEV